MSRGGLASGQEPRDGVPARSAPRGAVGLAALVAYLPTVGGWRRSTRGQVSLARARAKADAGLLTAFAVLVVLAAGLATAIPRQLTRTVDGGARQAVLAGGPASAIDVQFVARYLVDESFNAAPSAVGEGTTVTDIRVKAGATAKATPTELSSLLAPMTVSALSQPLEVTRLRDAGAAKPRPDVRLLARVGWADPETGGQVTWVQGQAPTVGPTTALHRPVIPVGVSQEAAEAWHLAPGARLTGRQTGSGDSTLVITGVYRMTDPDAPVWQSLESARVPVPRDPKRVGASIDEVTFLVDGDALTVAEAGLGDNGLWVHLRRPVDVPAVTGQGLRDVRTLLHSYADDEISALPSDPSADFVSTLPGIVDTYEVRARAVIAELSLVVVAVIGVGAVVLLLAAQLLTRRRRPGLALQHARGASLTAIGTGLLLESAVVAGSCLLLGGLVGVLLTPHADGGLGVWLLVAVLALGLNPLLGMLVARSAWATRKTPANRRARARQSAEVGLRRVVLDVIVLLVAVAAVVSLRTRGLSSATGVDPLLAAAPFLLTAGLTVVLLRLYPWPVRLAAALAKRRPSALPVVAAARARQALSWSPLLAMVLAVGLMVGTGLIRTTLIEGQEDASWQRVGADVRADLNKSPLSEAGLEGLRAAPGVTAACTGILTEARTSIGASDAPLTAMLVDSPCYRKVLQASGMSSADELDGLDAAMPDGSLRAVLAGDVDWPDAAVRLTVKGEGPLQVREVARASQPPSGWREGPVVILDLTAARAARVKLPDVTTLWVVGPGAAAAVTAQGQAPAWDLHDRQEWLRERSSGGVIADMGTLLVVALVLLALLAAIAMIQTTAAGSAERARAVSLLRTLGLPVREGNRLTMTELLPLVVVGVAAGAGAGFGLVELLGPSQGLEQVTGGVGRPQLRLAPTWAAAVLAAALFVVLVAAVVESILQRRQRLASVLRVGETR